MNKFIESLKHAIVEEDQQPVPKVKPDPQVTTAPPEPVANQEFHGENGDRAYRKVLDKTDFSATPVATTIKKYLDPLAVMAGMDEHTKFRTAVVLAKSQDGLTEEAIIGTFDGLKASLQQEEDSFSSALQGAKQREISGRQQRIEDITGQITAKQKEILDMQQDLSRMSAELTDAQGKLQRAESQFKIAAQRRSMEIDQEKNRYVELLKG